MVSARCIIDTARNTGAISAECDKTLMVSTLHSIAASRWASASVDVVPALDGIAHSWSDVTPIFLGPGEIYHPFVLSITYIILIYREMKCIRSSP
ncbi:hypothetical protein Zmor_014340 [Zophobas morio]|uniref:Uncharacterized protein n=1 Tax=Zophobas morio TaxID=2755281 RepID=A0AA38IHC3_9CUCU|nr:hypothetical protein Zmor_014340 [Zophobas morio]